jgi:GH15 family glucan-1,4-alpha-glucosidase
MEKIEYLKRRSIEVILGGQAASGAYLASPTFLTYNYSWFRDGSFISDAMSRVGETESAEKFFDWATTVITDRKDLIHSGEILHTRYTVDGKESTEEWSNFQLDGFGTLIWSIYEHSKRHGVSVDRWKAGIDLTCIYLEKHWKEPCHDWWEERDGIHATTLACIFAGLHAAEHLLAKEVKKKIDLEHEKLDASLIACATPFHAVSHIDFEPTLRKIEERLVNKYGGVHRHETDLYYGGGEWILLTCFLGWHYVRLGRIDDAKKKLDRVLALQTHEGLLPEQVFDHMKSPDHYDFWVEKWGPVATPLLWSHAMFLTLVQELGMIK